MAFGVPPTGQRGEVSKLPGRGWVRLDEDREGGLDRGEPALYEESSQNDGDEETL